MDSTSTKPNAARSRLLFVDDEPLVLQGLQRTLRSMRAEWDMNFVGGGEEALESLRLQPYDAIITDMRMPRMDGAQLLEKVKERYPGIVRIVLSGQANRETILRSAGPAHQYVSKPCDPQELKLRLAQAFAMRDLLQNSAVRALVAGLKSIPSPPGLYYEIQTELQSEDTSLKKIAEIVSKDAGMTAKILQLANSAFMGARYNISNTTQAVTLIGTEMVRALVLSVHVFSQFKNSTSSDCAILWDHSIAVACLAQRIAGAEGCPKTLVDESFTAGILHEIGKLVVLSEMPAAYAAILVDIEKNPGSLAAAERQRFGCTHADLGAYLMSIWGLPHSLVQAVAYHDRPADSVERRLCSLTAVHGADAIASSANEALIVQDVQWDEKYMQDLGMSGREPTWREFYSQQMERAKTRSEKALL
ncbi:MAG TPA: response regulator [Candidatus Sulfotelmatobacter sp.]|nr:response regulator [Candidatus Sulfotelmatobacter sp.]